MKKTPIDIHPFRPLIVPVVFLFITCIFFAVADAGDVTMSWDANQEENLAGYKLYYKGESDSETYEGTGATEGDSPVVIYLEDLEDTDSPTFTVTGLEEGQYYSFALTAFDTDGLESDFSEEVGTTINVTDSESESNGSSGGGNGGGGGCFISDAMNGL